MSVSVRTCSSADEIRLSLDIYNDVWPRRAVTAEDVDAWRVMSVSSSFSARWTARTSVLARRPYPCRSHTSPSCS